jgi:hypothetical protein
MTRMSALAWKACVSDMLEDCRHMVALGTWEDQQKLLDACGCSDGSDLFSSGTAVVRFVERRHAPLRQLAELGGMWLQEQKL